MLCAGNTSFMKTSLPWARDCSCCNWNRFTGALSLKELKDLIKYLQLADQPSTRYDSARADGRCSYTSGTDIFWHGPLSFLYMVISGWETMTRYTSIQSVYMMWLDQTAREWLKRFRIFFNLLKTHTRTARMKLWILQHSRWNPSVVDHTDGSTVGSPMRHLLQLPLIPEVTKWQSDDWLWPHWCFYGASKRQSYIIINDDMQRSESKCH